ncbi:MAG TPA: YiiD C-terminal domain-containing protein [Dokdonella sp.]|jgi:thioesterase domain-containing protein|nr:YiiD C-terminal domain-containing protein [Dokdonella sp.]
MTLPCPDPSATQARRDALRIAAQEQMLADIPVTRFMQLRIAAWDGQSLRMTAPLAPNVNDKGCAFGGSLVSVMTLACWSLVKLAADERGMACDIYVQDSTVRYLAPLWEDFGAESRLADDQTFAGFFEILGARGKARLAAECDIRLADGTTACSLSARFVALRKAATVADADAAQSEPAGST